jgi:hypothetical protein
MAKIEPGVYEPRDDIRVFDGAEDDVDEEGSRLPLLIVIALLVLAAFAGVVYLAYTEGVQKGRSDAPRVITAQPGPAKVAPTDAGGTVTPYKGLKIYEQPAPTDEDSANEDSAPPPPTDIAPQKLATTTATTPSVMPAPTKPAVTVAATTPPVAKPAPEPVAKPPVKTAVASTQPAATAAPRSLTPATIAPATKPATPPATKPVATAAPKPAPVETKPLPATPTPAATAPAASSGSYVLQIGAYKSQAEANAAFASLKAKNPAVMSGFSPNVKQVDLGEKGTWYRLRVGSFSDKEAAAALCGRLGGGCFPAKN